MGISAATSTGKIVRSRRPLVVTLFVVVTSAVSPVFLPHLNHLRLLLVVFSHSLLNCACSVRLHNELVREVVDVLDGSSVARLVFFVQALIVTGIPVHNVPMHPYRVHHVEHELMHLRRVQRPKNGRDVLHIEPLRPIRDTPTGFNGHWAGGRGANRPTQLRVQHRKIQKTCH